MSRGCHWVMVSRLPSPLQTDTVVTDGRWKYRGLLVQYYFVKTSFTSILSILATHLHHLQTSTSVPHHSCLTIAYSTLNLSLFLSGCSTEADRPALCRRVPESPRLTDAKRMTQGQHPNAGMHRGEQMMQSCGHCSHQFYWDENASSDKHGYRANSIDNNTFAEPKKRGSKIYGKRIW